MNSDHRVPGRIDLSDDEIAARFRAGDSIQSIADAAGVSRPTMLKRLDQLGQPRREPWRAGKRALDLPEQEIAERYQAGESTLALSKAYGVSRYTIDRRLQVLGIPIRGGSEANRIRAARMSPDERRANAAAAHQARRRSPEGRQSNILRAQARERDYFKRLCIGEIELAGLLSERGHFADLQVALGPYNIDLCLPPVAVEVHRHPENPLNSARFRERTRHLVDAGWRVVYVWLHSSDPRSAWAHPTAACADEVVAYIEAAQRDPSSVREYLVVRGSGELAPCLSLEPDEVALIPAPERAPYLRG